MGVQVDVFWKVGVCMMVFCVGMEMPAIWFDVQRQRSMSTSFQSNNIDYILEKVVRHNLFTLETWNESFESLEMGLQAWALFSTRGERQYKWPGAVAFRSWSWILILLMPLLMPNHIHLQEKTDRSVWTWTPPKPKWCAWTWHHVHRLLRKVTLSIMSRRSHIWLVSSVRTIHVARYRYHIFKPSDRLEFQSVQHQTQDAAASQLC